MIGEFIWEQMEGKQELNGHIECERKLGYSKLKIMERTITYNPDPVKEIELEL